MAVRRAPWWLAWLLAGGLVLLFVGERVLAGFDLVRALLSGMGALAVIASTVWRALSWRAAEGDARRVEGWLLLAHAGCLLALVGYLISSEDGMRWLAIDFAEAEARDRYRVVLQVLWTMLLALSLLPVLGAQLALGEHRHARGEAPGVESFRVLETATAGLTVALAGALLFVVGYLASERDETLDLSYFRTATPGEATRAMVSGLDEPLRVLLFFPQVNPVKDEVLRYFRELADATGRVRIEQYDRLASPRVAAELEITQDGTIAVVRGDQITRVNVGSSLATARTTLRSLDRHFQTALLPILRRRPKVYLTTGHGELNDSTTRTTVAPSTLGGTGALRELLGFLGYEPGELGLVTGLGADVPADASVVMVLGPRRPFLAEELDALGRFLARGGSLLLALDPDSDFRMGPLEDRLGLRYVRVQLANDEQHLQQRGDLSDRRLLVTNRFSSHEAVTTLARAGAGASVLMVAPGHLEAAGADAPDPVFVVRALPSTFADASLDYRFDEGREQRDSYALVAAMEAAAAEAEPATDPEPTTVNEAEDGGAAATEPATDSLTPRTARALVFASSSPFTDAVLVSLGTNATLVADAVKWLAREEVLAGETQTEEDVPIVHTREENVIWFHATILGAPALLLAFGLLGVHRRRRRKGMEP